MRGGHRRGAEEQGKAMTSSGIEMRSVAMQWWSMVTKGQAWAKRSNERERKEEVTDGRTGCSVDPGSGELGNAAI
jgi:hypothetical protein